MRDGKPREESQLEQEMDFIIKAAAGLGRTTEAQLTLLHGSHVTPEAARGVVIEQLDALIRRIEEMKKGKNDVQ